MMNSDNNLKLSFHIDKQKIRNRKFFIFGEQKFPIDFDLLVKNSNYFYKNRQEYENVENINILNDEKYEAHFPIEAIEAFISSCQNKPCQITSTSIFAHQYLSYKYEFPEITNITSTFINEHSEELVIESLLFKIKNNNEESMKSLDTSQEEEIITRDLNKFIKKMEMKKLPISILERIIQRYSEENQVEKKLDDEIINFLFDLLDERGSEISILFNNIDFKENRIGVMKRLLDEYSEIFDFNMINSTLLKTTTEITGELNKQKEEYSMIFSKMKTELAEAKEEVNRIRQQEEEVRKEYAHEIERIREENEERIQHIEQRFERIISQYEEIINRNNIQQHQRVTTEMMNIDQFDQLSDESKKYLITTIIENKEEYKYTNNDKCQLIQNILFFNHHFDLLSNHIKQELSRFSFIENNLKKCTLDFDFLEKYYFDKTLQKVITEFFEIKTNFNIEVKYPSKTFEEILKIIQISIPSSVTHISNYAFRGCSSLR